MLELENGSVISVAALAAVWFSHPNWEVILVSGVRLIVNEPDAQKLAAALRNKK